MMDLPNLFSTAPKKDKLFLGLILTEQTVQAVLWKIAKGTISVIKHSEIVEIKDMEHAIVQVDSALQELGELSENLSEVILGLEPAWVNPKGVIDEKKPFLKKLTDDLALKAIGFVVITEAISQYLAQIEPNLSSIFVFYSKQKLSVSLVTNGILQKTESVVRSDDTVSDLVEALARFKTGHKKELPPTIKLVSVNISEDELFEHHQSFINHDWVKDGYFVSRPALESLPIETTIQGVIHQGGVAVAKSHGLEVGPPTENAEPITEGDAKDFDFKEVTVSNEEDESTQLTPEDDNLTAVPKSFGIPISSTKLPQLDPAPKPHHAELKKETINQPIKQKKQPSTSPVAKWFNHHKKFVFIGFISGIVALLLLAVFFVTFSAKAVITLTLNPKNINKDVVITLDPKVSESNFSELILKSELITKDFSFNQTNETTGVTLVGEKASGKVQIINKTDGVKTFPAGTSLVANSIRFTLDDDVTVASASVEVKQEQEVKTYGSSEVTATAVKIGAEANVDNDTAFVIGDFSTSSYEARAVETFSGGSSREIRVVSQEDLDQLMSDVKKKILELASQEFKDDTKASDSLTYISTGNVTVTDQSYSGKEGDEAKTISLEASATVDAISFANGDIKPLAEYVLSDLIPEGYEMSSKEPQILSDVNEEDASGSAILIDANLSTQAVPRINYDALKQEVSAKPISSAQAILDSKADIKAAQIELFPKLLETIGKKLPKNTTKIELKVE